jgi:uncharacterized membrane protein
MTTFTVWKFDSPDGAEQAASVLKAAAKDGLVKIIDDTVASWPVGAARPDTKQSHEEVWHSTGWGALWGPRDRSAVLRTGDRRRGGSRDRRHQ